MPSWWLPPEVAMPPRSDFLLERHRPRLFATAVRLLGYRSDAEDAVQETCLAAIRHIGSVRDPERAS
jgi:DNA-directed RNA polymerase specialized sigma24 family protein